MGKKAKKRERAMGARLFRRKGEPTAAARLEPPSALVFEWSPGFFGLDDAKMSALIEGINRELGTICNCPNCSVCPDCGEAHF